VLSITFKLLRIGEYMADITKLIQARRELINKADYASKKLSDFCKPHQGNMGLISNEIAQSDEYKQLKHAYDAAKYNISRFMASNKSKELDKAIKIEILQKYGRA
jgi:hypothetical protein